MSGTKLADRISKLGNRPSHPAIIERINRAVSDDSINAEMLAAIIKKDQGLVSRILRLANSSYYGLSQKVVTIQHAITILGFSTVANLAMTVSVARFFDGIDAVEGFDPAALWTHSLATAVVAQVLMKHHAGHAEEAFMAGLLHDIGKVFMALDDAPKLAQALRLQAAHPLAPGHEQEQQVFGWSHAEVGALMARQWQFSTIYQEAIRFHHEPERAPDLSAITAAVCAANQISKALALGVSTDPLCRSIPDLVWEPLGVTTAELSVMIDAAHAKFYAALAFMPSGAD